MIVWGGGNTDFGRYNPASNSWTLPVAFSPSARSGHTANWTGKDMFIWGGGDLYGDLGDGARYNPSSNSWTIVNSLGSPQARAGHTAAWTGSEVLIWGGAHEVGFAISFLNDGGRYNPTLDAWGSIPTTSAPRARSAHTAVWTGSEMIVWGGVSTNVYLNDGARFNLSLNTWTPTGSQGAPSARASHTAVWTGTQMLVFGGSTPQTTFGDFYSYTPAQTTYLYQRP
jgi:N-acetylneuraminic acid mutarotase